MSTARAATQWPQPVPPNFHQGPPICRRLPFLEGRQSKKPEETKKPVEPRVVSEESQQPQEAEES